MNRLLLICFVAVLAGCAGPRQIASLDRERPASERDILERQALLAAQRQMEPTPSEKFDIAVIGGNCAPKTNAKFAVTACVNEQPCNGFGTRLKDGRLACTCYEVVGGCDSDSFCSHRTHQCVKLPADPYHAR
jgi:hypothetical protein